MTGAERISAERQRQIVREGWTAQHDDREHSHGELTQAALCYLTGNKAGWPWEMSWWKPSADRVRDLEKAGALIAAEIDRLERAAKEQADGQVVLANRCMRHRHIKPMNAVCADGAECPICALHIPPDTKDCVRCGAPRESTIHDTGSSNTEIRMAAHQFVAGVKD